MLNCDSNLLSALYPLCALAADQGLVHKYTEGSDSEIWSRVLQSGIRAISTVGRDLVRMAVS